MASVIQTVPALAESPISCKTGKKCFETEQEAIDFELKSREIHGGIRQCSYLCENCSSYHLTCSTPDSRNATANYSKLENSAPQKRKWTRCRALSEEEKNQIFEKYRKGGVTFSQLAFEFGTSAGNVYKAYHARNAKPQVVTIDSLSTKRRQLEEELARLQSEIERRAESARLKVNPIDGGRIQIKKEHQVIVLSVDDCVSLTLELEDLLAKKAS